MSYFSSSSTGGDTQYTYTNSNNATPTTPKATTHHTIVTYDNPHVSSTGNNNFFKVGIVGMCLAAFAYIYTHPASGDKAPDAKSAQQPAEGLFDKFFGKRVDTTIVPQVDAMQQWERDAHPKRLEYINRYKHIAISEQKAFGVLASITLAQGILESNAGQSRLTLATNNHFGMKCFSKHCKTGHCKNFTDDSHKDFFLCFNGAWASFRAHSKLLTNPNYRECTECQDYKQYAHCLKRRRYATLPTYAEGLIRIIELYQLDKLDKIATMQQ